MNEQAVTVVAENATVEVVETLLEKAVAKQEIGVELLNSLKEGFAEHFRSAEDLLTQANKLKITGEDDNQGMGLARRLRLDLVKVRTGADKTREQMKKSAMTYANAIQGMYNILKMTVEPTESKLYEMEQFAEIARQKRELELHETRWEILQPYIAFAPVTSELGKLSPEAFDKLLMGAKLQQENDKKMKEEAEKIRLENEAEAKRRAEEERIAKEKEAERKKKIEEENEKLRQEAKKLREEKEAEEKKRIAEEQKRLQSEKVASERIQTLEAEVTKSRAWGNSESSSPVPPFRSAEQQQIQQSVDFAKSHSPLTVVGQIITVIKKAKDAVFTIPTERMADKSIQKTVLILLDKIVTYLEERESNTKTTS